MWLLDLDAYVWLSVDLSPSPLPALAGHSMCARGFEVLVTGGFGEAVGYQRAVWLLGCAEPREADVRVVGGCSTTSRLGVLGELRRNAPSRCSVTLVRRGTVDGRIRRQPVSLSRP